MFIVIAEDGKKLGQIVEDSRPKIEAMPRVISKPARCGDMEADPQTVRHPISVDEIGRGMRDNFEASSGETGKEDTQAIAVSVSGGTRDNLRDSLRDFLSELLLF